MKFNKQHKMFHKDSSKTVSIIEIATQVVRQSLTKIMLFSVILLIVTIAFLIKAVVFPLYNELENLQVQTHSSLLSRNQEIMQSAVELRASNIQQLLISTELAVNNIITNLHSPKSKAVNGAVFPLDKEFYVDGPVKDTLINHPLYQGQPVSMVYPHIYYPDDAMSDMRSLELQGLKSYWFSFQQIKRTKFQ